MRFCVGILALGRALELGSDLVQADCMLGRATEAFWASCGMHVVFPGAAAAVGEHLRHDRAQATATATPPAATTSTATRWRLATTRTT